MKINLNKLNESINKDLTLVYESLNTGEAKKLYSLIVDLYEEISSFESEAPHAAINALSPHLNQVRDSLENMLKEPMNYVSAVSGEESEEPEEIEGLEGEEDEDLEGLGIEIEDEDEGEEEEEEDLEDEPSLKDD